MSRLPTVALLNLSQNTDQDIALSFEYVMARERVSFPIEDTRGDTDRMFAILNRYYRRGVRIFMGFSGSNTVANALPWFNDHRDAIGISLNSSASSLAFPKPIIRLTPSDRLLVLLSRTFIRRNATRLVLLVDQNELFARDIRDRYVEQLSDFITTILYDDPTLNSQLLALTSSDMIIPLVRDQAAVRQLFASVNLQAQVLGVVGSFPVFTVDEERLLGNRWIHVALTSTNPSLTVREMTDVLETRAYSLAYDAVIIVKSAIEARSTNIFDLINHTLGIDGVLELNSDNDRKYADYVLYRYDPSRSPNREDEDRWVPVYLWSYTPNLGLSESELFVMTSDPDQNT